MEALAHRHGCSPPSLLSTGEAAAPQPPSIPLSWPWTIPNRHRLPYARRWRLQIGHPPLPPADAKRCPVVCCREWAALQR